jgi:hypothetical protein
MRTILLAITLALSSPAAVFAAPSASTSSNPYVGTPEYKLASARVDAAHKAYASVLASWKGGQAKLDDVYVWSVRIVEAERDHTVQLDNDQMLKDHVKRMHDLEATVKAQFNKGMASSTEVALVTYYRLDAELRYTYERIE